MQGGILFPLLCLVACVRTEEAESGAVAGAEAEAQNGAAFLQSTMQQLHSVSRGDFKITGPTPLPSADAHDNTILFDDPSLKIVHQSEVPAPPLSNEELAALYQAAVNKGAMLDIASLASNNPQVAAGLHELEGLLQGAQGAAPASGTIPGYYYYYYPIKNFMKGLEDNKLNGLGEGSQDSGHGEPMAGMVPTAMMVMDGGNKNMEPLFMAIANFIGMALLFAVSVLFFPKFGSLRSRENPVIKSAPEELVGLTRVVFEALDGKDCSERIACEIGRAVRKMKLDNKPLRVLEILLPPALGKQMQQIRKSAARNEKCNYVRCKWKTNKTKAA